MDRCIDVCVCVSIMESSPLSREEVYSSARSHRFKDHTYSCWYKKEKYNSPEYLRTIEIFENWFWLSKKGNKNGKMELETMRMSISE